MLRLSDGRPIELDGSIGIGSYGTVYRGCLESGWGVKRPVAVKVIAMAPDADHADAMRHLGRIARRAACVRHPSVIQLLEVDQTDPAIDPLVSPFIVSELVEGESLASLMSGWQRDGLRAPVDFAVVVSLRAAEALDAALFTDGADGALTHLVHGDLSPRQILISTQGEVKVGDFGQFALSAAHSHVRARSHLSYTAPEVACGSVPTSRSDVFSLGVIMHELLVGPRFAKGMTIAEAARMVREGEIQSSIFEPNLPRAIRDIIRRATDKNPMDRYPHARALAFDLRREMLRLGLCDTQTCVRHAIGSPSDDGKARQLESKPVRQPSSSDIALGRPRPPIPSGEFVVRHEEMKPLRIVPPPPPDDTAPHVPRAFRHRR